MDYNIDWRFKKYLSYLDTEQEKKAIFQLYNISNIETRKRIYLYLAFKESNQIIKNLISKNALLTAEGLRNYLFNDADVFNLSMKFVCKNKECEKYSEIIESIHKRYVKCPSCEQDIIYLNKQKIKNVLFGLYLNYYDFYLLGEFDKTTFLIHNKFANKYYLKAGEEAFSHWILIKLIENGCDVKKILFQLKIEPKNIKKKIYDLIIDNSLIKTIDSINFKPELINLIKEENKKYFNIYSGNENLNKIVEKKDIDFKKECSNINELLFNLTGHDEKGINYLLDVLAMILQEPHIKTKQLIIFYGEEASGKGTFYDLILKPLFEGYITKILGKKIKSSFNGFMSKNLVLVLEEVKADKDEEDTLKELVTEDFILINEKGLPERYENNYLTIFGFSNEQNPINAGKRRGVYFRSRTLGGTTDKAPEFRKRYEQEIPKEFNNFITHLKNRKYDKIEVMKGYETEAKLQVLEQNMSIIERFCDELFSFQTLGDYISEGIASGDIDSPDLTRYLYNYEGINYVQAEFLLLLYNNYLKKQRYKIINIKRFSEFWQVMKIDKSNLTHWRRLEMDKKKIQYVNLDIINQEIKKRYDKE